MMIKKSKIDRYTNNSTRNPQPTNPPTNRTVSLT